MTIQDVQRDHGLDLAEIKNAVCQHRTQDTCEGNILVCRLQNMSNINETRIEGDF